jgi:hypothetical protein
VSGERLVSKNLPGRQQRPQKTISKLDSGRARSSRGAAARSAARSSAGAQQDARSQTIEQAHAAGRLTASADAAAGEEGLHDARAAVLESVVGAYADLLYDRQAVDIANADIALRSHAIAATC